MSELLHGEQRHPVGGDIVKSHFWLRRSHGVGERSAPRNNHDMARAACDRIEPGDQIRGKRMASAEFDDSQITLGHAVTRTCRGWSLRQDKADTPSPSLP